MSAQKATNLKEGKKRKQNFRHITGPIFEHNGKCQKAKVEGNYLLPRLINSYEKRTPIEIRENGKTWPKKPPQILG